MQKAEDVIRELLGLAEVEVNGSSPWDVQVHDDRFYSRVLSDTSLGTVNRIWMAGGTASRSTSYDDRYPGSPG